MFLKLTIAAAIFVGLAAVVIWSIGTLALRPAHRFIPDPPAQFQVERVVLKAEGAPDLVGWRMPERAPLCGVVAMFHGRGGARDQMLSRAVLLSDAGFAVLLFDFQGHGESEGDIVGFGRREAVDVRRVVAEARAYRPGAPLGVLGLSLGAAAVMEASQGLDVDAYVLEAMYASLLETTEERTLLPFFRRAQAWILHLQTPIRLGYWASELRPVDRIAQIDAPILLMGGGADPFATPAQSRALADAAGERARLVMVEGAGHEDFLAHDPNTWRSAVPQFFRDALCPRSLAQSDAFGASNS